MTPRNLHRRIYLHTFYVVANKNQQYIDLSTVNVIVWQKYSIFTVFSLMQNKPNYKLQLASYNFIKFTVIFFAIANLCFLKLILCKQSEKKTFLFDLTRLVGLWFSCTFSIKFHLNFSLFIQNWKQNLRNLHCIQVAPIIFTITHLKLYITSPSDNDVVNKNG